MDILQIIVLAVTQGITEFLPISSSAHLILVPLWFGFSDQGLDFDVALHLGSLMAVISYFRKDLFSMARDAVASLSKGEIVSENAVLAGWVIFATIPVGIAGLLFKSIVEAELRSTFVIAVTTIGFGLLLWLSDVKGRRSRSMASIGWKDALIIGCFQVLALIPGTSRSGITMTAGLMLGLSRASASRFSFLLAIPTILMSGGLATTDLMQEAGPVDWLSLGIGSTLSFVTALLCIHYFLQFIERVGMLPFVLYRLLLGIAILIFFPI